MPPSPPPSPLALAFPSRPDLRKRTHAALAHDPSLTTLFTDIATHIHSLRSWGSHPADDDRVAKKRKVAHEEVALRPSGKGGLLKDGEGDGADDIMEEWEEGGYGSVGDVSFSVPQRRKLVLEVGVKGQGRGKGIRARNAGTGGVEFGVLWRDIQHALCVPLPEKAQMQYNFVVFAARAEELLVWTVPEGMPKAGVVGGGVGGRDGETCRAMVVRWIGEGWGGEVLGLGEGGVGAKGQGWVKGFRGSKDGYLFFLPTGLFWGFKKPLFFFPFAVIDSVSYTSVLQRTFNLNVTVNLPSSTSTSPNPPPQDFEFSMLDQADFASIDVYIRTHNLHDASMAEQRRAKKLNINGAKGAGANADGAGAEEGDGGVGELERAAREVQEMEDEEEEEGDENFDPGSEGDSEGSGSGGSEEDEGGAEGEGEDLVRDELGSEAEEVRTDGEE